MALLQQRVAFVEVLRVGRSHQQGERIGDVTHHRIAVRRGNEHFAEAAALGTQRQQHPLHGRREIHHAVLDQLFQVLAVLAQQNLPVGVVVGRLGRIVLVSVLDALRTHAENSVVLPGAAVAFLDELGGFLVGPQELPRLIDQTQLLAVAGQVHVVGNARGQHEQHHAAQLGRVLQFFQLQTHHVSIQADVGAAIEKVAIDAILGERRELLGQLVGHALGAARLVLDVAQQIVADAGRVGVLAVVLPDSGNRLPDQRVLEFRQWRIG